MILYSTGGYKHNKCANMLQNFFENNITNIEFSGGLFDQNLEDKLESFKSSFNFRFHNYFPPPPNPFVFNLASSNKKIVDTSLDHAKSSIRLSKKYGGGIYSFHAGFLIDPTPKEIGRKVTKRSIMDKKEATRIFLKNVKHLSTYASKHGVTLMIENNVISKVNYETFGTNPVLMSNPQDTFEIMSQVSSNVKLLLDVAHLKVSSVTEDFDPAEMFVLCSDKIHGYHFSDNDGNEDTNHPFESDSWFWPYINPNLDYYSIEVYNQSLPQVLKLKNCAENVMKGLRT